MKLSTDSRITTSIRKITTTLKDERVLRTKYYVGKTIGGISTLAVVYAAFVFGPVLAKKYRFEEAVQTTTSLSAYNDHEAYQIQNEVFQQAHEIGIPLKEEDLHVTRDEKFVRIEASYSMPVSLWPGKDIQLSFSPVSQEKSLDHALIQAKKLQESK